MFWASLTWFFGFFGTLTVFCRHVPPVLYAEASTAPGNAYGPNADTSCLWEDCAKTQEDNTSTEDIDEDDSDDEDDGTSSTDSESSSAWF